MKTISEINREDCFGCELCSAVCAKNAISMVTDSYFYYPMIDQSRCIKCGKCFASCPMNLPKTGKKADKAYMLVTKNTGTYKASAAGGFFATAARYIIKERKGVAVGAAADDRGHIHHICIDDVKEIQKIQGKKYVQSAMTGVYKEIESCLKNGKRIIFGGTPCQIFSVRQKFGNNNNLYLVDFACDGVSSPELFKEDVERIFPHDEKIEQIIFQSKDKTLDAPVLKIFGHTKELELPWNEDLYLTMMMAKATFRESCYRCPYFGNERQGDISMAVCRNHPGFHVDEVVSVIYPITLKGIELWEEIKNQFDYVEIGTNEEKIKNIYPDCPAFRPKERDIVFSKVKTWFKTQTEKPAIKPRQASWEIKGKFFSHTSGFSGIKKLMNKTK